MASSLDQFDLTSSWKQSIAFVDGSGHALDHWRLGCIGFAASDLKGHMVTRQISGI
jgi:hypothetical protein